jgi:hypothetical protein
MLSYLPTYLLEFFLLLLKFNHRPLGDKPFAALPGTLSCCAGHKKMRAIPPPEKKRGHQNWWPLLELRLFS